MIETRYMQGVAPHARIVAHLFYPIGGVIEDDDTEGSAMLAAREEPSDVWPVPHELAARVPYGVWKTRVEQDGFTEAVRS